MRKPIIVVWAALALTGAAKAEPITSGPQAGQKVPGPFKPLNVTGPDAGKHECLYCKFGARPAVMVFARQGSPALAALVKKIDAATAGLASRAKTMTTGRGPNLQYRHSRFPASGPLTCNGLNGPGTFCPACGPDVIGSAAAAPTIMTATRIDGMDLPMTCSSLLRKWRTHTAGQWRDSTSSSRSASRSSASGSTTSGGMNVSTLRPGPVLPSR